MQNFPLNDGRPIEVRLGDLTYESLSSLAKRKDCTICSHIYSAVTSSLDQNTSDTELGLAICKAFAFKEQINLSIERSLSRSARPPRYPWDYKCAFPVGIQLSCQNEIENSSQTATVPKNSYVVGAVELVLCYNEAHNLVGVKRWDRRYLNIHAICSWLEACETKHDCSSIGDSSTVSWIPELRVVDVLERNIKRVALSTDYAALSYVWSTTMTATTEDKSLHLCTQNEREMERAGSLSDEQLPGVIADALQLCADLGQRYLWVDRLCIVQDDLQSKYTQINAMDNIYQHAQFTIVGAADDTDGLPGTPKRPRKQSLLHHQWLFHKRGLTSDYVSIYRTKWATRGWTYQEHRLSKRLILFTSNQIFLSCSNPVGLNLPWETDTEVDESVIRDMLTRISNQKPLSFGTYQNIVHAYSKRELTHSDDILRAFAGIAGVFCDGLKTQFHYGLPEDFLLESMLWRCWGRSARRKCHESFPSWSWAAWEGSIRYNGLDQLWTDSGLPSAGRLVPKVGRMVDLYLIGVDDNPRELSSNRVFDQISRELDRLNQVFEDVEHHDPEDLDATIRLKKLVRSVYESYGHNAAWNQKTIIWLHKELLHFVSHARGWCGRANEILTECHGRDILERVLQFAGTLQRHKECQLPSDNTKLISKGYPGCLVFYTSIAKFSLSTARMYLDLSSTTPQPSEDSRAAVTLWYQDIYDHLGNVVGRVTSLDQEWDGHDEQAEFAVIAAGDRERAASGRVPERPLGAQSDLERWALYAILITRHGDACHRAGLAAIHLEAWEKANPQWETIILG
jgi:hypothetical protein